MQLRRVGKLYYDFQFVPLIQSLAGAWKGLHFAIIDEVDQITETAQYQLLSRLDSTQAPPRATWVFTCNSIKNLEDRFISRCMQFDFSTYGLSKDIASFLSTVWQAEGGTGQEPDWPRVVSDKCSNIRNCLNWVEAELLSRS